MKSSLSLVIVLYGVCASVRALGGEGDPLVRRFDFGTYGAEAGWVSVTPETRFSHESGFGFDFGSTVTSVDRGGPDPLAGDFVTSKAPFYFSVGVPEGNYRVTVIFGDREGESDNAVKAESRRLMVERLETKSGEVVEHVITVNVRNSSIPPPELNAPGGSAVVLNERELGVLHWDDKLTLEFNGRDPKVCGLVIEPVDVPTVFLVGDSTVTDQPRDPGASWGQMLPRFLKPEVAVANHAESGETLKSFLSGLRLAKVLSQMKAGDYLFIQFGHNDQKKQWPQTYVEAHTTYKDYLKVFIDEARLRGAIPVLVTPMQRRQFDAEGRIRNSHGDYPEAVRAVAREESVALVDLERMSIDFYEALGPERAPLAFAGDGRDVTHHNNYGAYELAKCVVEGIREAGLPLARSIVDDFSGFDPAFPDPVDSIHFPVSPTDAFQKPRGD